MPTTTVTPVDTAACHTVNHTTRHVWGRPRVSTIAVVPSASTTSVVNGQT